MTWIDRLLHPFVPTGTDDAQLQVALERTAKRVEPQRLQQARGWPQRFRRPIAAALAQARRVAEGIPGPVELDADHYTRDPFVHALFASAGDMNQILGTSVALRDYARAGARDEAYALLSMRREEKHILGMEDEDGWLRKDVLQRVVWFTDHRLSGPAASLTEARDGLTWTLFDRFLEHLVVGIERLRADKARLTAERDLALDRLRHATPGRRAEWQRRADAALRQLREATEALDPVHLYEVFETVLSHPQDCLYLAATRLTLDSMGIVHPDHVPPDAATLTFVDLVERDQERRTVVMVHCRDLQRILREGPRLELQPWMV